MTATRDTSNISNASLDYIRDHYIKYRVARYLLENPDALESKARKYARVAWSRKLRGWKAKGLSGERQTLARARPPKRKDLNQGGEDEKR